MPINHEEMIDEIEGHIRKFGGAFGEWCVGTAKDSRGPFFRRHLAADLGDGLAYREAFSTSAAQAVVAHLVNIRGLQLDQDAVREAERRSAPQGAVPEPGKIVFVYHQTRDSRLRTRNTGLGVGDSGLGIRDSGEMGAAQGTPQPGRPVLRKLAA